MSTAYNVYQRTAVKAAGSLGLPTFAKTDASLSIEKSKDLAGDGISFVTVLTRTYSLATSLIPPVVLNISMAHTERSDGGHPDFDQDWKEAEGVAYQSSSGCWGLTFLRQKDYGRDERDADYILQLTVIFLGQSRNTSNLAPGLHRQVRPEETASGG
jgi:hypothetical protein